MYCTLQRLTLAGAFLAFAAGAAQAQTAYGDLRNPYLTPGVARPYAAPAYEPSYQPQVKPRSYLSPLPYDAIRSHSSPLPYNEPVSSPRPSSVFGCVGLLCD